MQSTATNNTSRGYTRLVLASCFGTAIEWYDFFIYAFLAPLVFDKLFFPKLDPKVGTIAVFATFAVGFFARPLGGIVFGHYGDRIGRKSILLITLLLMGVATTLIGLLPTYEQVGILAPIALVVLRFLQGFALGGESIGALLLTVENSPQGRRGFFGSLVYAAGPFSIVMATLAVSLVSRLPEEDLLSWGWRVPFVISIVLVAVGIYVRLKVEESASFAKIAASKEVAKVPLAEVFRNFPKPTAITLLVSLAETSFFYLTAIFAISYGIKTLGMTRTVMTDAVLYANCVAFFAVPLFGSLSDRIGRKPVFMTGVIATMVYIYPFFLMLGTKDPTLVTLAIVLAAGLIHPLMFGPEGSFFAEQFETRVRFSGVSFGKQVGTVLGGGLAPLIASTLLLQFDNSFVPIVIYFLALATVALFATIAATETRNKTI
jgi:MHS family shikimate/dehydroshikimate transporter-like MFS transporter